MRLPIQRFLLLQAQLKTAGLHFLFEFPVDREKGFMKYFWNFFSYSVVAVQGNMKACYQNIPHYLVPRKFAFLLQSEHLINVYKIAGSVILKTLISDEQASHTWEIQ